MDRAGEKIKVISIGEFVSRLFALRKESSEIPAGQITMPELLRFGHFRGWLEDSDERNSTAPLNRQTAARITHEFLRLELKIPDLADISPATKLKDLYTCRVCANHIAQIYCRGIMSTKKEEPDFPNLSDSSELFFNHLELITTEEAATIIANCEAVKQSI